MSISGWAVVKDSARNLERARKTLYKAHQCGHAMSVLAKVHHQLLIDGDTGVDNSMNNNLIKGGLCVAIEQLADRQAWFLESLESEYLSADQDNVSQIGGSD